MAWPWGIEFEDAVYHVTSRGNSKQDIFLDDEDRGFFLSCLARACQRFERNPRLLPDEQPFSPFPAHPAANLSRAIHWLNGTYTGRFNRRHRRNDHLLQGRYKSVLIADDAHYLQLSMYLHLNPLRAGLVDYPYEYFWSSYHDYTSRKARFGWLNRDEILSHYITVKLSEIRHYQRECLGLIGKTPGFVEQLKTSTILGPRELVEKLVKKFRPAGKTDGGPEYSAARNNSIDVKTEIKRVAEVSSVPLDTVFKRHHNFPPRLAAYCHLAENCGLGTTEVAQALGVRPVSVSGGIRKFRQLAGENKSFGKYTKLLKHKTEL